MKKTIFQKISSAIYLCAVLLSASVFFNSCNDHKEPDAVKTPNINCVIINRAQIQNWVDSGWTKPGSKGKIKEVVLQFSSSAGGNTYQLIGYPGDGPASVHSTGKISLQSDTACTAKSYSKEIVLGNNILRFDNLNIINASDGSLNKFDYIRLTPEQEYPPYINFKVEVVAQGQASRSGGSTLPCPTFCGDEPNDDQ
ncbi:MAG: hypothetical protein RIR12_1084 [Bacteroidota bacterium]|jgi:hypothetical protein